MYPVRSITRLTLDPEGSAEILLDFGDLLEEELFWPGSQRIDEVIYDGAEGSARFPRGGRDLQLGYTRIFQFSTPYQARLFGLAQQAQAPWDKVASLLVEWNDGSSVIIDSSALGNLEARNLTLNNKHWCYLSYDLTGGKVNVDSSAAFAAGNWDNFTQTFDAWSGTFGELIYQS